MLFNNEDKNDDSTEEVQINVPEESNKEKSNLKAEVENKIMDKSDDQMLPGSYDSSDSESKSESVSLNDIYDQNKKIIKLLEELNDNEVDNNELL